MGKRIDRRAFLGRSLAASGGISLGAGTVRGAAEKARPGGADAPAPAPSAGMPTGTLGAGLIISRLLLGGNLLTHYCHSRDLRYVKALTEHYNTDAKILDTLALAEANGIGALMIHNVPRCMAVLREHRARGGRMKWITCTAHALCRGFDAFAREIDELIAHGADALYISGIEGDTTCGFGNGVCGPGAEERSGEPTHDILIKAFRHAKASGLPTGVGAHRMGVVADCEKLGLAPDFYVKTFHHANYPSVNLNHDSRWCDRQEQLIALMTRVKRPWIAFKTMAAGAIPPADAFRYAFANGADFIVAGMFDFEIVQDAKIARDTLAGLAKRARPWMG